MKIERVELRQIRMPYVFPFETSVSRDEDKDCLLVRLSADGVTGWGESPVTANPYYKEETVDTAWPILAEFVIPRVLGRSFEHPREVSEWLHPVRRNYLAKAGVESAAWAAWAEAQRVPLARALGGTRSSVAVGMSVGIEPTVEGVLKRVETWLAQGYQRIKIKIKPGFDLEVVDAIRGRFGMIGLQVDANTAYTLADIERMRALDQYSLMMIEQPLDHADIIDHAVLQAGLETPICLDECIRTAHHAEQAITAHACGLPQALPISAEELMLDGMLPGPAVAELVSAFGTAGDDLCDAMAIRCQRLAQQLIVVKAATACDDDLHGASLLARSATNRKKQCSAEVFVLRAVCCSDTQGRLGFPWPPKRGWAK